jgi:hypothetical protein
MSQISDFTDRERWIIQSTVDERWGPGQHPIQAADVELTLDPHSEALTQCPAAFWAAGNCNFVIAKTGEQRYRCQFFYNDDLEQLGPSIKEFDDVASCAVTLLRTQADHDSVRSGAFPDAPRPG